MAVSLQKHDDGAVSTFSLTVTRPRPTTRLRVTLVFLELRAVA